MVITDRFVFVHMPKTGGTFVTHVLEKLHNAPANHHPPDRFVRFRRLFRRRSPYGRLLKLEPKHGTCAEIPATYDDRPILSVVRSPYDWYVSQYEFAWWKKTSLYHPEPHTTPAGFAIEKALPSFERAHPHFPEISFAEFMQLCDRAAAIYEQDVGMPALGLYTHGFLRYYYRDVARAIAALRSGDVHALRDDTLRYDASMIRTDRLNEDLAGFLAGKGYRPEDLAFVPGLGRILPLGRGRTADQNWERYYTPSLKESVRARDWALFELFPEFDV